MWSLSLVEQVQVSERDIAQICVGLITALIVHIVLYYKCSDFGKLRTREGFDLLDEI